MGTCGGGRTRRIPGHKDSSPRRPMRTFGKFRSFDHDREIPIFSVTRCVTIPDCMTISTRLMGHKPSFTCPQGVRLLVCGNVLILYGVPRFGFLGLAISGEIRWRRTGGDLHAQSHDGRSPFVPSSSQLGDRRRSFGCLWGAVLDDDTSGFSGDKP